MKTKPPSPTAPVKHPAPASPVTREMVQARSRELARLAGRLPPLVIQADYDQARRELTGESDLDRQEAVLNAMPEDKRWDPIPGSAGHQAPEAPFEGEDAEGRSEVEQLAEEGVDAAERDQILQAALAAARNAKRDH